MKQSSYRYKYTLEKQNPDLVCLNLIQQLVWFLNIIPLFVLAWVDMDCEGEM